MSSSDKGKTWTVTRRWEKLSREKQEAEVAVEVAAGGSVRGIATTLGATPGIVAGIMRKKGLHTANKVPTHWHQAKAKKKKRSSAKKTPKPEKKFVPPPPVQEKPAQEPPVPTITPEPPAQEAALPVPTPEPEVPIPEPVLPEPDPTPEPVVVPEPPEAEVEDTAEHVEEEPELGSDEAVRIIPPPIGQPGQKIIAVEGLPRRVAPEGHECSYKDAGGACGCWPIERDIARPWLDLDRCRLHQRVKRTS